MFKKVMVANRGAVAARILRALRTMGVRSAAVYSEADSDLPYLAEADEAHAIGPAPAAASYLAQERLIDVLQRSGADSVHPGYGFLSENSEFARRVEAAGAVFIGPSPRWIETMGHKTRARDLATNYGWPMASGSDVLPAESEAVSAAARRIGYPVLVKPAAGGGGIGMLPARSDAELLQAVEKARSLASRGFANPEVYLERLLERPRHIEFQVIADRYGSVQHLFERDCSVQRRHQKIIEEAPAPALDRCELTDLATRITATLRELGYDNIGTVEMLRGNDGAFGFLEMNTRLQVEHGVTEEITGVDLVQAQIRTASGERLEAVVPDTIAIEGHAIEVRVYAEDPKRFFPSPGPLNTFRPPREAGIRIETGYAEGNRITPHYDPLLAKVIAKEGNRDDAIAKVSAALEAFEIRGVKTNIPALLAILRSEPFQRGEVHTGLVAEVMSREAQT